MKALIDYTNDSVNETSSEIALVISNKPGVKGLALAHQAGIPTLVGYLFNDGSLTPFSISPLYIQGYNGKRKQIN